MTKPSPFIGHSYQIHDDGLLKHKKTFLLILILHGLAILLGQLFAQDDIPESISEPVIATLFPLVTEQEIPSTSIPPPTSEPSSALVKPSPNLAPTKPKPNVINQVAENSPTLPIQRTEPLTESLSASTASTSNSAPLTQQAPVITTSTAVAVSIEAPLSETNFATRSNNSAAAASDPSFEKKPAAYSQATPVNSSCEKPRYPAASARLEEEGVVSLRFLINESGQVINGNIEKSSGYKRLDDAALNAINLCKFKPATRNGKTIQEWTVVSYRWVLIDD